MPQEEENLPSMDVEATEAVLDGEPHPAVKYFSERLQELAEKHRARLRDSDKVRKLTPSRLQQLLCEIAPDVPVSQTQMYRYYNGKLAPRIDLVYELAYLFDVSPRYFFPESAEEAGDK
ncbi:helix-turn-helix domain-containing protein [Mycobacteroides abscessus]|uniref:helix-turn-helix domain-containing protein n=1 Tax=Mycobacteroides abscessus TaxID=36809 RepID=UPI001041DD82|nr:helix-turn-helix transcriptional regulator [Mycobacteroides abscessus]